MLLEELMLREWKRILEDVASTLVCGSEAEELHLKSASLLKAPFN